MQQGTDIATGAHYPRQYKAEAYKMEVSNVDDEGHNTVIKNDARSYGRHDRIRNSIVENVLLSAL